MRCNSETYDGEDMVAKINRQIARAEQCIDLLLNEIEVADLNSKGRLDCAIKIMSIFPRLLILHERCIKSSTDGMSEAEKTQQAALADIMRLLEEECSEERDWRTAEMNAGEEGE